MDSTFTMRLRVGGHLASVRWGPGELQAPASKRSSLAPPGAEGDGTSPAVQPIPPSTVQVVGIEYDDPGHGKHDGTHNGERLFTCPDGHGSFVKLEKVENGMSIQKVLAEKYFTGMLPDAASKRSPTEAVDAVEFTDSKGREKEMTVQFVGRYNMEQRQQRLESFIEVALAETNLESRYPEDIWEGDWSLPNVKSLWLDRTLLSDWADIMAICELCPRLEWLSLARTRLRALPPDGQVPAPRCAPTPSDARLALEPFVCRIQTLVLTSTLVTWEQLLAFDRGGLFPFLQHLHLAQNRLVEGVPEIKPDGSAEHRYPFPRLRSLQLDDNGIADWYVLHRATRSFPSLEELHLNNNLLGVDVQGLADVAADQTPRRLTTLFINDNRLSSWETIGALTAFAVLELKAQRNPITEGEKAAASAQLLRQVLIALMPTMLRLNSSEVTVKERVAAERYFLSLAQKADNAIIKCLSNTCDMAATTQRLLGIHGEVIGGNLTEEGQASRVALVNLLVEVVLSPRGTVILDKPPVKKRVPHTMTVAELKRLCHQLFKSLPLNRIELRLADPGQPMSFSLDDDSRELGFFGVGDGSEILIGDTNDAQEHHVAKQAKPAAVDEDI